MGERPSRAARSNLPRDREDSREELGSERVIETRVGGGGAVFGSLLPAAPVSAGPGKPARASRLPEAVPQAAAAPSLRFRTTRRTFLAEVLLRVRAKRRTRYTLKGTLKSFCWAMCGLHVAWPCRRHGMEMGQGGRSFIGLLSGSSFPDPGNRDACRLRPDEVKPLLAGRGARANGRLVWRLAGIGSGGEGRVRGGPAGRGSVTPDRLGPGIGRLPGHGPCRPAGHTRRGQERCWRREPPGTGAASGRRRGNSTEPAPAEIPSASAAFSRAPRKWEKPRRGSSGDCGEAVFRVRETGFAKPVPAGGRAAMGGWQGAWKVSDAGREWSCPRPDTRAGGRKRRGWRDLPPRRHRYAAAAGPGRGRATGLVPADPPPPRGACRRYGTEMGEGGAGVIGPAGGSCVPEAGNGIRRMRE